MSMKMTAFWDVAPCSFVEVDRYLNQDDDHPDDEGSTHICNVGLHQLDYTVLSSSILRRESLKSHDDVFWFVTPCGLVSRRL
jgi:hypothetical protein